MDIDPSTDLHENQKRLLLALADHDGRANTTDLREATGLEANTIGYHTSALKDADLITLDGTEDVGAPAPAKVYELTDQGQEFAEGFDQAAHVDHDALVRDVEQARDRIAELEDDVDDLETTVEANRELINDLLDELRDLQEGTTSP